MITVGVTGRIGSGKTTVCRIWENLGARVFYADDEAKQLMASDPKVKEAIQQTFGKESYFPDGELNRKHLSEEAFQKGRVQELNNIVHPAVRRKFSEEAQSARESDTHIFVKEAALMDVRGRGGGLDYIVIVSGSLDNRVRRVIERDQTDRESVLERNARQPDYKALHSEADFIIHNDGTLEELEKASAELFEQLLQLSGRPGF